MHEIKNDEYSQSGSEVIVQPDRPSKSSQKQSKSADMGQTGYAREKGQF